MGGWVTDPIQSCLSIQTPDEGTLAIEVRAISKTLHAYADNANNKQSRMYVSIRESQSNDTANETAQQKKRLIMTCMQRVRACVPALTALGTASQDVGP